MLIGEILSLIYGWGQHPFKLKLHHCCNDGVTGKYTRTHGFDPRYTEVVILRIVEVSFANTFTKIATWWFHYRGNKIKWIMAQSAG